LWQSFDTEASALLGNIETSIKSDPRFANALGVPYNLLLPIYLQTHASGAKWGIQPIAPNTSLIQDFITIGQRAFQINYNMIGASSITFPPGFSQPSPFSPPNNTVKKSVLFDYAKASDQNNHCWDDDICTVFAQTNPTTQAIQKAQNGLYYVLKNLIANGKATWVQDSKTNTTVIVDVAASWDNNWQGYSNAYWTSMQAVAYGQPINGNVCPDGTAIVGIWQIPKAWAMSFLCQAIPGYPAWNVGTSIGVQQQPIYACSGNPPLCNYDLQCPGLDLANGGGTGSVLNCYHREDGSTMLPTKGTCTHVDYTFTNMPAIGSFYALPGGTYLTGYNMTLYGWSGESRPLKATYYYCGAQVDAGSLGSAMSMGNVGGVPFPNHFNVFTFGNITGLRDVQGPVAAGGSVDANSFNINWAESSVGLVSKGFLNLVNGTVRKATFYAAGENLSGVTYNSSINIPSLPLDYATGQGMNFEGARTQLQTMSKNVSRLTANGSTTIAYGNITLKSKNPTLNIFLVSAAELKATYSVTIDVPATSTVIINVSGASVSIANAGLTAYVGPSRILWNLYESTDFYASSVGIPGSVLAPFAQARLGGNINGTLVADTLVSTNEFHQVPFEHNWLVP
jgi:choice-of-anchor A domain-containing protein